jgi:hypothetical protein
MTDYPSVLDDGAVASGEVFRYLSFPYEGGVFPSELGVVVMRTVLDGSEPARIVTHWADGDWSVEDGVNDAMHEVATIAHMAHVVSRNSSVAQLATMPPGFEARREGPGFDWTIQPHVEPAD